MKLNFPLYMYDDGTILAYRVNDLKLTGTSLTLTLGKSFKLDVFENIIGGTSLRREDLDKYLDSSKGLLVVKEVKHPLSNSIQKHVYGYLKCGDGPELYATYYSMRELSSNTHAYALFVFDKACLREIYPQNTNDREDNKEIGEIPITNIIINYYPQNRTETYSVSFSLSKPWEVAGHRGHRTYPVLVKPQLLIYFDKVYKSCKYGSPRVRVYLITALMNFVEQLLGSILVYNVGGEKRQLPFVVFSSASNLGINNGQYVHLTPMNYYSEVGTVGLYLEIDGKAIQPLVDLIKYYVIEAIREVSQTFRNLGEQNELLEYLEDQEREEVRKTLEKLQVNILIDGTPPQSTPSHKVPSTSFAIDPKALLKALLYHTNLTASTCRDSDSATIRVCGSLIGFLNDEELQNVRRVVRRVFKTFTRQDLVCIDRVDIINGDVYRLGDSQIPSCYTRVRWFESELHKILKIALRCKRSGRDENACLVFAYFLLLLLKLLKNISSILQKKNITHNLVLSINFSGIDNLAKFITIKYLELGFHGLLHLFRKAVASQLNMRENLLGEILVVGSDMYPNNMFVDNYVYRLTDFNITLDSETSNSSKIGDTSGSSVKETDTDLTDVRVESPRHIGRGNVGALMLVYIRSSGSFERIHSFYSARENAIRLLETLFDFMKKIVIEPQGFSKCYYQWLTDTQKIRAGLSSLFQLELNISQINQYIKVDLNEFEMHVAGPYVEGYPTIQFLRLQLNPGAVRRLLYLPTSDLRRIFTKSLELYVEQKLNAQTSGSIGKGIMGTVKRDIVQRFRIFEPAILNYYAPQCFDGCYGCTVSRACEVRNPLVKEWITSKDSIKTILEMMGLQQSPQ